MKILHTGDWHLGHTLAGYDRTDEQLQMLDQMVRIVSQHRPDVFLLCGDVYHTSQPSTAVQTIFNQAIIRLHDACPEMTIIVTAGNHDSGSKHEIFRRPWEYLNVHMIGTLNKEHPATHIISIPHKGYVIAIPYTHERNLQDGFIQSLLDEVMTHNHEHLPVVLSAHTTIAGADFSGHDRPNEQTIGGIDAMSIQQIGSGYDYLALGHIHHGQFVHTGKHNVRYAGSPLPVSFDENYDHSVTLVELSAHGEQPVCQTIAIHNPRPLTTLPSTGAAPWEEVRQQLADFPDDLPNYIRVNVSANGISPSEARQEALQLCEPKQCRFCVFNVVTPDATYHEQRQLSVREFQQMQPLEVARLYAKDMSLPFDDDMQDLFEQTLQALTKDNDPV